MSHTMLKRGLAAAGVTILAGVTGGAPLAAQSDAPPGNNGTIKIDDVLLDDGNENVPHPGCTFVVDFFGYDVGTRTAVMTFDGQDPTGGGELLVDTITFDVATRESGNQLNTSRSVDLSSALVGIEPHPKQGWHVKLTVNVDGAQGADVKHKVYWVSECTEPALVAAQEASLAKFEAAEVEAAHAASVVQLATDRAAWMAALEANAANAAVLSGSAQTGLPAPPSDVLASGDELPRTGLVSDLFAGIAMALVACGVAMVLISSRFTTVKA